MPWPDRTHGRAWRAVRAYRSEDPRPEMLELPCKLKCCNRFENSNRDQLTIASAVSTCAVVYKDEMYDLKKGRQWTFDAPAFGVPFGAKHISVHIELPDSFSVVPEAYRQFLQYTGGEQLRLQARDFAELVLENRPQWLIDLIRSFAPDSRTSDQIRDELQRLLNQLRVRRVSPKVTAEGATSVTQGAGPAIDAAHGANMHLRSNSTRSGTRRH